MALDATYGGANANTYLATVSDIRALAAVLAEIPGLGLSAEGVVAASDAALEIMAVMAADSIDTAIFLGNKSTSSQARAWPRINLPYPRYNATTSPPDAIKQAQVAQIMTLASPRSEQEIASMAGVSSYSIGEQSVAFGASSGSTPNAGRPLAQPAEAILRAAGLIQSGVGSVYVPRG